MPAKKKSKAQKGGTLTKAQKGFFRTGGLYKLATGGGGTEHKYYDAVLSANAATDDGVVIIRPIVDLDQGPGASQRIGRQIWVKSLSMVGWAAIDYWTIGSSFKPAAQKYFQFKLVMDTQTNGSEILPADYMDTAVSGGSTRPQGLQSYLPNLANSERFITLKTWKVDFAEIATPSAEAVWSEQPITLFKKFPGKGIPVEFSSTEGTITEFKSNNLYVLMQNTAGTGTRFAYRLITRIRFTD